MPDGMNEAALFDLLRKYEVIEEMQTGWNSSATNETHNTDFMNNRRSIGLILNG